MPVSTKKCSIFNLNFGYEQGFTISGARARLDEAAVGVKAGAAAKFNPAFLRREIQSLLDVLRE